MNLNPLEDFGLRSRELVESSDLRRDTLSMMKRRFEEGFQEGVELGESALMGHDLDPTNPFDRAYVDGFNLGVIRVSLGERWHEYLNDFSRDRSLEELEKLLEKQKANVEKRRKEERMTFFDIEEEL